MVVGAGLLVGQHVGRVAESFVLGQRGDRTEGLSTLGTLDLHATVGVHSFVAAKVGELGVRLGAHLALEWFEGRMDVRVLLQARRGGKGLAALWTRVASGANVMLANVPLEV